MNTHVIADQFKPVSLDHKFTLEQGRVYLTGNQSLVRLALDQRRRDTAKGWNTGGFISGYRGSPLGRFDMELWATGSLLKAANIHFMPGLNEELAATAVWGTQYVGTFPQATVDGVFSIWYGKGPGVDRALDALKHANYAGTSSRGGVLVMAGDDHSAKSSTIAHQSDFSLIAAGIPVLYPATVQDILDFGLLGIEMSRATGLWVGLKLVTDVVESGADVEIGKLPSIPWAPAEEVRRLKPFEHALNVEQSLTTRRLPSAVEFARRSGLNRIEWQSPAPTIGIISAGKAYSDTMQALQRLGVTAESPAGQQLRVLKVGMVWPLDDAIIREFATGLGDILVVEEKRPLLESQTKSILYDAQLLKPPVIRGKFVGSSEWSVERGEAVLPINNELSVQSIMESLAGLLGIDLPPVAAHACDPSEFPLRKPGFCSGCPHSTSTRLPEGSRALAGIGCHTIAMLNNPETTNTVSQMGGEGVMWLGQEPFTDEPHVFANMGDGTYFHSGALAIRQAVAAKATMTYKLLLNGFVSMTGGQPIDGELGVEKALALMLAEGVKKVVIVTDDLDAYEQRRATLGVPVYDRADLEQVQRELREYPGVSVILYDQACATERRRLRKRGKLPDPKVRTYIHPEVCEGCGDCGQASGCLSIEPLETPLGRKRQINQSSCNKDLTCVKGFCPSFVTLEGADLPRNGSSGAKLKIPALPAPRIPVDFPPTSLLVAGIGGTGVVTIGALLTMAAHMDGKASSSLDLTGLSQKYGAVGSHIRLACSQDALHSARIGDQEAQVMIGCDLIVAASDESVSRLDRDHAFAVVNSGVVPTSDFSRNPDWHVDEAKLRGRLQQLLGERVEFMDARHMASALLADEILANMMLFGFVWQRGLIPVSLASIEKAIQLNGVAIESNLKAFALGRWAAHDIKAVSREALPAEPVKVVSIGNETPASIIADRQQRLLRYQNQRICDGYSQMLGRLKAALASGLGDIQAAKQLTRMVAIQYFRVIAVKDEYEVARLYASPEFKESLRARFSGDFKVKYHLAGGPFGRRNEKTGQISKTAVGPWIQPVFRVLSTLRHVRGTWLDPLRNGAEARLNKQVREAYEQDLELIISSIGSESTETLYQLAQWPETVRGYGHVREAQAHLAFEHRLRLRRGLAQTPTVGLH
ncbi:indolepyruvate ferredoxin oxidoreductase family protein [Pseudomonas sp. BF-R-24]|uniref:indolepyruvate ferredoxin oxidoreductase family protein n=1 Tax=Pseudomonas sp. BF-R-24 TaxID=2832386 RepID=UPI001CBB3D48|nr:indolepyruvate ferredoxin oxidoreductase family protein [Pseudomonas sp. BF-R-24]